MDWEASVTGIAAGTVTITYTDGVDTAYETFTVNANPDAISGASSVCMGSTISLSETSSGGVWSSTNSSATIGSDGDVTGVTADTATILYTFSNGCMASEVVTVNPLPATISGHSSLCVGAVSNLTSASANGIWTSVSANASVGSTSGDVTGISAGTADITYTLPTGCMASTELTVNPLPASISGSTQVCIGSSASLTSATNGGTWMSSNASATIGSSSGIVTGITADTTTINYTIATGCATSYIVTVNPLPAAIDGTPEVCQGAVTSLSNTTSGGFWSSSSNATVGSATGDVTGVTAGTAAVSYILGTGCMSSITVTIDPLPTTITGSANVCLGSVTSLFNTISGGTWSSSNANAMVGSLTGDVTGMAAGTTEITYAVGCGMITTTVTINPLPASIDGIAVVCLGSLTSLSDVTTGGTWTSDNSYALVGSASGVVTGSQAGTSTIIYTISTGCAATTIVTVNPLPALITGSPTVCLGAVSSLVETTGGGTWSSSSSNVSVGTAGNVSGISVGTASIYYTLPTSCLASIEMTVNPLPASINGTTTFCAGLSTSLSNATSGGLWSSSDIDVAVGSTTGAVSSSIAGTAIITYELPTGCYSTNMVTIDPSPAAISGTKVVCEGLATTLSDPTSGGSWSNGNTHATIGSAGDVMAVTAGTTIMTYTLTDGCMAYATVTVNPSPAPINGVLSVCAGLVTSLSDATSGGTWTAGNSNASIGANNGAVTGISAGTTPVTYTLPAGCMSTNTVTINPLPAAITGTRVVCASLITSLSDVTAGGTWSSSSSNATVGGAGDVTGVNAGNSTITYALTATGCISTVVVTVNPSPGPINGVMSVCAGSVTSLSDASTGGTWTAGNSNATVGASNGAVTGVSAGTTPITYTLPTSCMITTTVTINPLPATITGTPTVCAGLVTSLSDVTTGGTWSSSSANATVGNAGDVTGVSAGNSTITYALTATGCISTVVVTVNPLPANITGIQNVCEGLVTSLSDPTNGGTWTIGNANASIGASTGYVTGMTAGTSGVTYTLNTGCIATTVITVNPLPSPITGTTEVCTGLVTSLSSITPGGNWTAGNARSTVGGTTGYVTGVTAGTSNITYTLSTGCLATTVVTVDPLPAAITGTPVVCEGLVTSLSNVTANGTWYVSNPNAAIGAATGDVTGLLAGTTIVTYMLPTGCISIVTATINPLPATISGNLAVCNGLNTSLSNAAANGTWNNNNINATIDAFTGVLTGLVPGTTLVTYTLPTGCLMTTTVMVNPLPAPITGTPAVCEGGVSSLSDAATGGNWSSSTTNATVGALTGDVSGITAGSTIITYALNTGCIATAMVTVNPVPAAVTGTLSVCTGLTTTLNDATFGGLWSRSNTNIIINTLNGIVTGQTVGTAMATYMLSTGCSAVATITVNSLPAGISGTLAVCRGLTTSLSNGTTGGTWSNSNTNASIDPSTGVVTGLVPGATQVTYTLGTGCIATSMVTINSLPPAITGNTVICNGLSSSLRDGSVGGSWSSSNPNVTIGSVSGVVTGVFAGTSSISYTLNTGCLASTAVTVNPLPSSILGTTTVCNGLITSLSDATPGGTWIRSNGNITVGSATGDVTGMVAGTAVVSYQLGTGCAATAVITVNALPSSIVGFSSLCLGTTVTLTDPTSGGTWSSSNPGIAVISSGGIISGIAPGTTTITYTAATGCIAVKTFTVFAMPSLISGIPEVCRGATTTLANAGGGTWRTGTPTVATIGATTGVLNGIAPGTTNITYTLPSGCATNITVTVDPVAAITGNTSICAGSSSLLSNTVTGGNWSSSNPAVASVGAFIGLVASGTPGTTVITYTTLAGCTSTATVTTLPMPAISGLTNMCVGGNTTFTNAGTGSWISATPAVATISAAGIANGVSAGTATISYLLSTGCVVTTVVNVNPLPATITGVTTVCQGNTTALSDPTSGGNWYSSNASVASVDYYSGMVTGLSPATATISYTLPTGCVATRIVNINALPLGITGTTTICAGQRTTLADLTPWGGWSSINTSVATVSAGGVVTGTGAGSTLINYTLSTGCLASTLITVNPLPAVITGTATLCAGETSTLNSATFGGTWVSGNTHASVGFTDGILTAATAGTSTITYTDLNGCTITKIATVNALPAAISGPLAVCQANMVTLSDGTTGGSWSSSDISYVSVNPTNGVSYGVAAGSATLTYTLPTGCIATTNLTVNSLPAAITGASNVCVASTIALTNTGGTWSTSSALIATIGSTSGIVTGVNAGAARITFKLPTGCMNTTTVTVDALPAAITGTSNLCEGASSSLHSATTGGTWTSFTGTVASIAPTSGLVTAVTAGVETFNYILSTGCLQSFAMTVNPLPAAITGTTTFCAGGTTSLTDATSGGAWTSSSSVAVAGSGTGVITGVTGGAATITYRLSGTGCYATTAVSVDPFPAAITGSTGVCVGAIISLSDPTPGGTWSSSNSSIASISGTGILTGIVAGSATITYTSAAGCNSTRLQAVNPLPVAGTISGATHQCIGTSIDLVHSGDAGTWSSSNTSIATVGLMNGRVSATAAGVVNINYTVSNVCGSASVAALDTVIPAPFADTIGGKGTICDGHTLQLHDATTGGVWSTSNPSIATVSTTGLVTAVGAGDVTVSYAVSNECGTATSTVQLTVHPADACNTGVTPIATIGKLNLYPNPSTGLFTIDLPATGSKSTLSITDMLGKEVVSRNIEETNAQQINIDLVNFANGSYIVKIISGNNIYRSKIEIVK